MPRHATRYALPVGTDLDAWLRSDGTHFPLDEATASRRARAATLMMLALPGSAYLYQGEELGLLEVADLAPESLRDPVYERTEHRLKGRDGCRVPLPWTTDDATFGFGNEGAWLPQPAWFARYAVTAQVGRGDSSLELYRQALSLRRSMPKDATFNWVESEDPQVLHFARSDGWECMINFSPRAVCVPGKVLLSSDPTFAADLEPETCVWLKRNTTSSHPDHRPVPDRN